MNYITIYFEDKPVYLTDDLNGVKEKREELMADEEVVYMEGTSNFDLQKMPREIRKPHRKRGYIYHDNLQELTTCFFDQFLLVQAAGGVVKNENNDILLILRHGKWDLPKGKLTTEEPPAAGAAREVMEETGLQNLTVGKKLGITFHTYVDAGTLILKETHWFAMTGTVEDALTPQGEESITEVKWVPSKDIIEYFGLTYKTIEDVLKLALETNP